MYTAPCAAVSAVGTGVVSGAMRCGPLSVARAAPAIASLPDPAAAYPASAAPTSARPGVHPDTNDFATGLKGKAKSNIYLAADDDCDCHWWDSDDWAHCHHHDHDHH